MSGDSLGFPLPLPVTLGPWVLPKETLKAGHFRRRGIPRLPALEIPFWKGSAFLGTQRACKGATASGLRQERNRPCLSLIQPPGTPELRYL